MKGKERGSHSFECIWSLYWQSENNLLWLSLNLSAFWTKVNTLGTFSTSSPSCIVNKGSKLKQQSSEKWILESLSDAYTYYSYCYHVEDNMREFSLFASNSLDWTNVAFSCNFILLKCLNSILISTSQGEMSLKSMTVLATTYFTDEDKLGPQIQQFI